MNEVFDYLEEKHLVNEAIAEKQYSLKLWQEIKESFKEIDIPKAELRKFIENSIEYGLRFFKVIDVCIKIIAKCRKRENVKELLTDYDKVWEEYKELEAGEYASTSYNTDYRFSEKGFGFNETLEYCRKNLNEIEHYYCEE